MVPEPQAAGSAGCARMVLSSAPPGWRNGRRRRLKPSSPSGRVGSNPTPGMTLARFDRWRSGISPGMAKAFFAPFSIVMGLAAGAVAGKIFDAVWGMIDEEEAPDGSIKDVEWPKLLAAAFVQGAIFRVVKVSVDRGTRRGFMTLTGTWPGDEKPEKK